MPVLSTVLATVSLNPDASQLPGTKTLQGLANGIGWWALIACMVGVIIGAVMWGFSQQTAAKQGGA